MIHEYERLELSSSIVAVGYKTNKFDFVEYLTKKGIKDKYGLEYIQNQIKFSQNISEKNIAQLLNNSPIIGYKSNNNEFSLTLLFPEAKISITNNKFDENNNKNFENFAKELLDENLSQIKALGVNYNAVFKKANKLKLFNKKIEQTNFFQNNITFSVTIPTQYNEKSGKFVGTYTIQKINKNDEENTSDRYYNFQANYNFDLTEYSALAKCENIPKYIEDSSKELFNLFVDTYDEFLSLNYE